MTERIRIIKKGTPEWWSSIAITNAKVCKVGESVTVDVDEVNHWIDSINRNPFKRFWILLTNGDIRQRDITEAEKEALLKITNYSSQNI